MQSVVINGGATSSPAVVQPPVVVAVAVPAAGAAAIVGSSGLVGSLFYYGLAIGAILVAAAVAFHVRKRNALVAAKAKPDGVAMFLNPIGRGVEVSTPTLSSPRSPTKLPRSPKKALLPT
jgi:hypothetical protein